MYYSDTLHRIRDGSYSDLVNCEGCRNEWQCVPCDIKAVISCSFAFSNIKLEKLFFRNDNILHVRTVHQ